MKYLLTGGTGLIGQKLSDTLLSNGHEVAVLSRSVRPNTNIKFYKWDLAKDEIPEEALMGVDCLIHLAGAGIVDKKWNKKRKKEIIDSRVEPLNLLYQGFQKLNAFPKTLISASGIGYYGFDTGDKLQTELHENGEDFIAEVVRLWEAAADDFGQRTRCRVVKIRTGMVLDQSGGALPQMDFPVRLGLGSAYGSGEQWISWIHHEDLCEMYYQASVLEHFRGAYNGVSPNPVQNEKFMEVLSKVLSKPFWAPKVPEFVMKLMLQERAKLVLFGNKVSSVKVEAVGFKFKFPELEAALRDIYKK